MNSVTLVLIVRNEAEGLKAVLPMIDMSVFDQVLAIDGNSTDPTRDVLAEADIKTYIQAGPGLGAAMLEARGYVNSDSFIFFHPDGNEDPADLPRMAQLLREGKEFVVASRMIAGAWNEEDSKILKWRKWANNGFALIANTLFARKPNRTSDICNGFRGISCEAFDRMKLTSLDPSMDYQMVIRALKFGIPITEFPTKEGSRVAGVTKFPSIETGLIEVRLLVKEILISLKEFCGSINKTKH